MNVEVWLVALGTIAAFIAWGIKRYKSVIADGVTLDEVLDVVEEAADKAEEVKEAIDEAVESLE